MLRLTEVRLPLDHADGALRPAIVARLGITSGELLHFTVFKRGHDARKKSAVVLIYTVDCEVGAPLEAALRARFEGDPHVRPTPDTAYRLIGQAPAGFFEDDVGPDAGAGVSDASSASTPPNGFDQPTQHSAGSARSGDAGRSGSSRGGEHRLRPVVVGFGPCGIFAALVLAQMGLRPIVLVRGMAVRERTKYTWGLWRQGVLLPESNVLFGEGGA
ncbi:MAG: hypothetical protein JWQ11_2076, partial [Rhizobacter sp.]|nr:hypothetical protein [Rhizobacter sp.]